VFVHLERDANTGRPELRLLVDVNGTWNRLLPIPAYLNRPDLGSALADMGKAARAGIHGADVRTPTQPTDLEAIPGLVAWNALPLASA
jgi:hypothetical protein